MKLNIFKTGLLILMLAMQMTPQLVSAGKVSKELSSGSMVIVKSINYKKNLITTANSEVAFNSSTIVFDVSGDKASITDIKAGLAIMYSFDDTKRYFLRPTATKIWIKSKHPMLVK